MTKILTHRQACWSKYLSRFNLVIHFCAGKLGTKPNALTSNGTSILKRGIASMPASIHRSTARYSLPSNWHYPSKLPPYQSQSSMDLSSWMLKGSIQTSGLNSKRIPFLQNTSTISQTPSGPLILMGYCATSDASMSKLQQSPTTCSPVLTWPSHCRSFWSEKDPPSSPHAILLVWTSSICQELLQIMHHLFPCQTCAPQTLWTSQATSNSQEALEFHIHGFHREAPSILSRYSRLRPISTSILHQAHHLSSLLAAHESGVSCVELSHLSFVWSILVPSLWTCFGSSCLVFVCVDFFSLSLVD